MIQIKPIELTLSGLNSFREQQRIDFESLCADGIFGIFGPTGSGKSTLLDAVTLALYGTVERAANNTQGILNQLEDQLAVAFTFELNGAETTRYQAERSYKRAKDNGLRLSSCRLMQLAPEKQVLADKEREMSAAVQKILGLTHDDFTRAVVLPQGKFAEFLSLKGNERRKMLQRIFHLEKYGDALNTRLKNHSNETYQQLMLLKEKAAMLGEPSRKQVQQLKSEAEEAEHLLKKQQDLLEKAECAYTDQKSVLELQHEKALKQKALRELEAQKDLFEKKKQALQFDQESVRIFPYLESLNRAEREYQEAADNLSSIQKEYQQVRETERAKKKAADAAAQAWADGEPDFTRRRQNLTDGLTLQRHYKELQGNRLSAQSELDRMDTKMREDAAEEAQIDKALNLNREQAETLEQDLTDNVISTRQRTLIQEARDQENKRKQLRAQIGQKREEWTASQKQWLGTQKQLMQIEKERSKGREQLRQLLNKYQRIYFEASAVGNGVRIAREELEGRIRKLETENQEKLRHALAAELAAGLSKGAPCPVCGALDHPNPAIGKRSDDQEAAEKELKGLRKDERKLISIQQENMVCLSRMEQQAAAFAELFTSGASDLITAAAEKPDEKDWNLQACDVRVRAVAQDALEIARDVDGEVRNDRELKTRRAALDSELKIYAEKKKQIELAAADLQSDEAALQNQWSGDYPAIDSVEEAWQNMCRVDKKMEEIRERLRDVRGQGENLEKKRNEIRTRLTGEQADAGRLKGRIEESNQAIDRCQAHLAQLGLRADQPLSDLLKKIDTQLSQLSRLKEQTDNIWRAIWTRMVQLEKQKNSCEERLDRAEKARHAASGQWQSQLKKSPFSGSKDVLRAHLETSVRERIKLELANYDEQISSLTAAMENAAEKLAGRSVTDTQVQESRRLFQELKSAVQKLIERRGSLDNELKSMQRRYRLFTTLEAERKKTEKAADQLEKLQRVFRGNAFVEFVAEEQLQHVCVAASRQLGELTRGRYALESDAAGGFVIRDNGNGGICRPVSSLSGGETFLTSLALALALSEQIQLSGNVPLQFFFLDEGFGTLDPELLDTVLNALEKLHLQRLSIGVISHVPEMRERLPRKLIVEPAEPMGRGSRLHMETL